MTTQMPDDKLPRPDPSKHQDVPEYDEKLGDDDENIDDGEDDDEK